MKVKLVISILLFASLFTAIYAVYFLVVKFDSTPVRKEQGAGDIMAGKRGEWEQMMYRDPATGKIPEHIRSKELEFAGNLPGSASFLKKNNISLLGQNWTRRGPYNIGGRTRALALDVLDENIILAGGVSGGMWRSTNGGTSWTRTTKENQLLSISCLAQDGRAGKENIWYAGTGEFIGNSARISGDGIYKSSDRGINWELIPSTMSKTPGSWDKMFDYVWNIVVNPVADSKYDEVYAAVTGGAICRSTDGGNKWSVVLGGFGNNNSYFTDIAVTSDGIFYATMSEAAYLGSSVKGIYRSTNGIDWINITPQDMPPRYRRVVIGLAPSDENQVFFLAESPGFGKMTRNSQGDTLWHSLWKYIYLSGDGSGTGGIWSNRTAYLPNPDTVRWQMNSQSSYDLLIRVKPDNPDVVFIGGVNLYRSTDGFTSNNFTVIGGTCPYPEDQCEYRSRYPNHHADQHAMVFLPSNPDILFTGSDGGVHKTLDVMAPIVDWLSLNSGYYTTQFYTCAIDHGTPGNNEIIGGLQDNGTIYSPEDNPFYSWTDATRGDGLTCCIEDGGSFHYTSINSITPVGVKMYRLQMDNDGKILVQTRIDPAGGLDFIWNCPILLDPNNQKRMYVGGGKLVWRNNDLSQIPFVKSSDSTTINWDSLSKTRTDKTNPIVKRDGGVITAMDVSKSPANIVYYGTSEGEIFRIDDADKGDPQPINVTGSNMPIGSFTNCIKVDPDDGAKVFVIFSNYGVLSVFYSSDKGLTWTPVSGNLEEYPNGGGNGPSCKWLEIVKVDGMKLYLLGTTVGLFSSAFIDGQFTCWQQEGALEIGNCVVDMIDSRDTDKFAVAATHGNGVFQSTVNTLPTPPAGKPALIKPVNDSRAITDAAVFKWQTIKDAVYYKVQFSTKPDFSEIWLEKDGVTADSVLVPGLEPGLVKYYWRVAAKNAGGLSEFSDTWVLTTIIGTPELAYPEHKADSIPLDVTLMWNPVNGADSYRIQISPNFAFTQLITDSSGINDNSFKASALDMNKRYYWRVSAKNSDAVGSFSLGWYFHTQNIISVQTYYSSAFNLSGAYPSPFSTTAKIEFYLNKRKYIRLKIFDERGRLIKTLIEGEMPEGRHESVFYAGANPSGVYYLLLEADGTMMTKPVVLLR